MGDGTSGLFIWGAQIEQRSTVTAYTVTTTAPITNYIPVLQTAASGVPRFEHNPLTGESLGLEIEEQRTNLATYSEQFNTVYTTGRTTVTANTIIAPDGTLTGDKIVEDNTAGEHFLNRTTNITVTNGVAYTFSWYAKKAERTKMRLYVAVMNNLVVFYDLETGTATYSAGGTSYSFGMQDVGNGWWRCFATSTTGGTGFGDTISLVSTGTTVNYTGNGFNGIYIWGAQLELGGFSTSYIKTEGSTVTRIADLASMTGTNFSSWYRQDEGTVYSEAALSTGGRYFQFESGASNQTEASQQGSTVNLFVYREGVTQMNTTPAANAPFTANKVSFAYKSNDCAGSINAGTISSDTSVIVPVATTFRIMNYLGSTTGAGTVKKIAYYPVRVTNAQLQGMTTA
jgi:hypothetical protein